VRIPAGLVFFTEESLTPPVLRGAVVHQADCSLIIWERRPSGALLGIPVMPQTGPRHRSHVQLSPAESREVGLPARTAVIRTGDPLVALAGDPPQVVGYCPLSLQNRIATTIRRALSASMFELGMTAPAWWPTVSRPGGDQDGDAGPAGR
jgi:hypothetical protein